MFTLLRSFAPISTPALNFMLRKQSFIVTYCVEKINMLLYLLLQFKMGLGFKYLLKWNELTRNGSTAYMFNFCSLSIQIVVGINVLLEFQDHILFHEALFFAGSGQSAGTVIIFHYSGCLVSNRWS